MQRNLRNTAWVLIANASLLVTACATAIVPDVGGPAPEGPPPIGGNGGSTGGSSGAVASAGAGLDTNGGKAGASEGGAASGEAGREGGTGGSAGTGAKGGAGGGGKAGTGGGGTGGGGKAGTGGGGTSGGTGGGGKGGTSGGGTGGGGTSGGGTGGGGTSGGGTGGGGGGGVNLITNSGFETNTTGWSVFGGGSATIATSTAQAHSGTQSLLITGRTQPYHGPQYNVLSLVTPGTSYSLSLWGRLPSSNATGSLTVTVHYTCSGGSSAGENYFPWVATSPASASSWTQFSGVQTFPTCAGGGSMTAAQLYIESPTATLSYYVDDVVLTTP